MKIGILSDTHTKLAKATKSLNMLIENGAEFIIHAGDLVKREMLELLESCGKEYIAVYGNNDSSLVQYHNRYKLVQEPHYFRLEETRIKLVHLPFHMAPDSEIVIFGHTHKFSCEFVNGTLFLNPGENCARKKPLSECAMLEIDENQFVVTYYTREKKANFMKTKEFSFQRKKQ